MGLIKAALNSMSSGFGDQFKEFVECPQVENNVIIQRGVVNHGEGNKHATEGVISNGSVIAVPQGMAMMIVDNGKIVEFTAEPGTFTWDTSSEPSIFTGGLGKGIIDTIKTIGSRITFGGQTAKDQRVYYVNIKTIPACTFGSSQPETVFDPMYGSVEITYNGEFSIKVEDPVILINEMVGAHPDDTLTFDDIFTTEGSQNILKSRFAQKISEGISNIMLKNNISFNRIQAYKSDVTDQMNELLNEDWYKKYGIVVADVALRINASEASRKLIQEMDADIAKTTRMGQAYSNNMAGTMAAASAEAMKNAAGNPNGAMMGFMGMGMSQMQGNSMLNTVSNMQSETPVTPSAEGAMENATVVAAQVSGDTEVKPKFCTNCGKPVSGKFCGECGTKVE